MAFSNIENSEKLNTINIAIVDNEDFQNSEIFKETFKNLSDENNENTRRKATVVPIKIEYV